MTGRTFGIRPVELLAPGGSMEGIRGAVNAGADAVYAGGRMFGARAYAQNPETEDLLEAIDYCHLHGAKLYLTVNTLLKEEELTGLLPEYLAPIYEHGVDAVLVQDFGVFHFLKKHFPDLPLHASTQMTLTGPDGVKLLQEMGAERVVLSRELSLEEIRLIRSECDVELETFVHGALCYCYSGKCLMSSMIGGRSGNRGRCAQPCRLPYDFYDSSSGGKNRRSVNRPGEEYPFRQKDRKNVNWPGEEYPFRQKDRKKENRPGEEYPFRQKDRRSINRPGEQYLLSPKDICTLRLIPDLVDAGITSLKIEGRMKSPEYASGVTAMYRRYLDLYLESGRDGFLVEPEDEALLAELFSRGEFSEGYYLSRNGRNMMVLQEKKLKKGESLRHAQETTDQYRKLYVEERKEIPLEAKVSIRAGEKARIKVSDGNGHSCIVEGFVPDRAKNQAAECEMIRKQIDRTGGTDFQFASIDIDLEEGLFVPVRELNELRRCALDAIREEILRPMRRRRSEWDPGRTKAIKPIIGVVSKEPATGLDAIDPEIGATAIKPATGAGVIDSAILSAGVDHPCITASVCTQAQLEAVLATERVSGINPDDDSSAADCASEKTGSVIPDDVSSSSRNISDRVGGVYLDYALCTRDNVQAVRQSGRKAYLMLPQVWRADTARCVCDRIRQSFGSFSDRIRGGLDGILVRCYDQLHTLKDAGLLRGGDGFEVIADASLYTWNREARQALAALGVTMDTLPYECSAREIRERGCEGSECVIYGYQTLMVSAQCLVKTTEGCRKEPGIHYLKDRRGVSFPVKNDCAICTNTILNSVPLDLVSVSKQVRALSPASVRYLFTVESGDRTGRILEGDLPEAVTRGHFRKGAM